MADNLSDNFRKIANDKTMKFQWGVAEPSEVSQPVRNVVLEDVHERSGEQSSPQVSPRPRTMANGINFKDLPVKQSEIITSTEKQKVIEYHKLIRQGSGTGLGSANINQAASENKETVQRLNQLKNEFEILRGMMIDSKIMQGNKNYDKTSNLSRSNVGSASHHTANIKTGQAIRGKDKLGKSKISSSSMSDKDLNIRQSSGFKLKDRVVDPTSKVSEHRYTEENREKDQIRGSKISNKKSQHRSQNPRTGRSKNASRVTENQPFKSTGLVSHNLLQKHNIELQLRNALQKIQLLLQNEILLKTRNNDLEQALKTQTSTKQPSQDPQALHKLSQLQQKLSQSEQRIEQYRAENRELIQRIGRLEADAIGNQSVIDMLKNQRNRDSGNTMAMKINFANLEIENKRLQMEKGLERKQLEYEIERLKREYELSRNNQTYTSTRVETRVEPDPFLANLDKERIRGLEQTIRTLEQELQDKDKRYKQSLADLQQKKHQKEQAQLMQLIQNLQKRKVQGQGQNQLARELTRLKDQLIKIKKQSDLTQSQFGIESKVISLEQALKRDTDQKQKYLLEIQQFQSQYQQLKQKYKAIQLQLQDQTEKYMRMSNKMQLDLDEADGFREKYQWAIKENQKLTGKIEDMEGLLRGYEAVRGEVAGLREVLRRKEAQHGLEMKDARRRVDHAQFESFKTQEQNKISLNLNRRKLESDIEILTSQLQSLTEDRNYYRDQFSLTKQQNQQLIFQINDLQVQREPRINIEGHLKVQERQAIRRMHEEEINNINRKFLEEQGKLVEQIAKLTRANQEMTENMKRLIFLESQNDQLRALCRSKVASDSAVLHLWEIKEIQYQNIDGLLKQMKKSENQRGGSLETSSHILPLSLQAQPFPQMTTTTVQYIQHPQQLNAQLVPQLVQPQPGQFARMPQQPYIIRSVPVSQPVIVGPPIAQPPPSIGEGFQPMQPMQPMQPVPAEIR